MGWVVNATPRPLYPLEWPGAHCIRGWVGPGPVWQGAEYLAPMEIRSPHGPARIESLYRLSYRGSSHIKICITRMWSSGQYPALSVVSWAVNDAKLRCEYDWLGRTPTFLLFFYFLQAYSHCWSKFCDRPSTRQSPFPSNRFPIGHSWNSLTFVAL